MFFSPRILRPAWLCLLLLVLPAQADEARANPRAVVELFTSQGCASCPPADKLLTELSGRSDVVALSYHVDYWDYAGWPDTFAAEEFTALQRNYAAAWRNARIYTPQMVVNGAKGVVGSRRHEVEAALARTTLTLPVSARTAEGMLAISAPPHADLGTAVIWVVAYRKRADVAIERGENSGHTITYSHVVTRRQAVGMWEPGKGADIKLPFGEMLTKDCDGLAVLIQEERNGLPGRILGAATLSR